MICHIMLRERRLTMSKKCLHSDTCPVKDYSCRKDDICVSKILVEYYFMKLRLDMLTIEHSKLEEKYNELWDELRERRTK